MTSTHPPQKELPRCDLLNNCSHQTTPYKTFDEKGQRCNKNGKCENQVVCNTPVIPKPQKEYIIMDSQIKALEDISRFNNDQATFYSLEHGALRTRPYTPASGHFIKDDGSEPDEICKRKPICPHYPCGMEKIDSYCGEREVIIAKQTEKDIEAIQKRIDNIFEAYRGETNEKLTVLPYAFANGLDEAIKIIRKSRE